MTDQLVPSPTQEIIQVDLVEKAKSYARASKSEGTIRTYNSAWKTFDAWCDSHGVCSLPATTETIIAFVVEQADRLRPVTIQKMLTAISQAHRLAGHPSPTFSEPVKLVMQGIRRTKGIAGAPKRALRVEHIKKMVAELPDTSVGIRDKAIVLLGFVAGMRRSEIVALDLEDVSFEPEGAVVTIRRSKRDQEGRGRRVAVPRGRHEATCPVRAVRRWIETASIQSGALFVRLDPGASCERLSDKSVALVVKRRAEQAGLDPEMFAGHSLRRGFCTEAARAGASERDIARTTGHRSMAVLRGYVEDGTIFEGAAAGVLDL